MPSVLWVSLPSKWRLEEVQAGLQVVIALLSTWGIFAFSRFCWQLSSNLVRKNRAVALSSLMSINTIGEAFDVVSLLKRRIFRARYWKLLAQSIVVVSLTVSTIVSGPIAKASTRYGTVVRVETQSGWLATQDFNSRLNANVDWNITYSSLRSASFPLDQLLDYMPDQNSTWQYRANEWNNTWTMQCNKTENTPISIFDTGRCANLSVEIPAIVPVFPFDEFDTWATDWASVYKNSSWLSDALLILVGWSYDGFDPSTNITYNMTVTIVSTHIHNTRNRNKTTGCQFGPGQVEEASYSKMECFMQRPRTVPSERFLAKPFHADEFAVPKAYTANYYDRMVTESNAGVPVTMLSADELIRFYQTYLITKDYQKRRKVNRYLTTNVRVVQLSSTFIAFGALYALLVLIGLVNFAIFAWKNSDVMQSTPESKLDWIVQSILDENESQRTTPRHPIGRRSVYAQSIRAETLLRASEKTRLVFENAKYGSSTVEESAPLTSHGEPPAGSILSQDSTPGLGLMMSPTHYGGYAGDSQNLYNMNPYEATFASQQMDHGHVYELQNPENTFTSDRRRGYQRIG